MIHMPCARLHNYANIVWIGIRYKMGTGSSIPFDEDGDLTDNNPGVIKRIPIEVPSRHRGTFLRSVGSFGLGRRAKGVSLRSAMSMDLDSSEVDKIRRDFEMYKISKQNEMSDLVKKEKKLESENRRLRAELQALQKTCNKLILERDSAREAEYQALERASTFELDRNKVQRQFKIFRETKESEIRDLMKKRRDLETVLQKTSPNSVITGDSSGVVTTETGNPGDWWTQLESEPSLGSTSQLQPMSRVPEPVPHLADIDNNFYNRGGETTLSAAVWNQVVMSLPSTSQFNVVRVYVSAPKDMHTEVELLKKDCDGKLRHMCKSDGRFFVFVHLLHLDHTANKYTDDELVKLHEVHRREVQQSTVFLSFLGEHTNRFTAEEFEIGHVADPGARPAIFCFRNPSYKGCKNSQGEAKELKDKIRKSGCAKLIDNYSNPKEGAEKAYQELERVIRLELGECVSTDGQPEEEPNSTQSELDDSIENLCGSFQWDVNSSGEQLEAYHMATVSTCELGFEKHYERLNEHVAAAGPLPPFLVSGTPGSGKSLLLAKWISLQQRRNPSSLVLYHFVGNAGSSSASTINMIRRLTAQLMQYATNPPALASEPNRLLDEFPKWLERISTKIPGGVILVLDSLDLFQNGESQLQWLLDPLPIDARLIVSANPDNCPQAWRSWPTLHLEPLSPRHTKELLYAICLCKNFTLSSEDESRLLSHCRMPATRHPLYITVLVDELIHSDKTLPVREKLDVCLKYAETAELYRYVLESMETEYEDIINKGMIKRICQLIYMSRNGMAESELFDLIPNLSWNFWAPVCHDLLDRHVLTYRAGTLIFAHEQAREAVQLNYCLGLNEQEVQAATKSLIHYHIQALKKPIGSVTARIADELPWLLQTIDDMERLQQCVTNSCIFRLLYQRGLCAELLDYWQAVGKDKPAMAEIYFDAIKKVEQMDTPLVTQARIADMYEMLGRFLKDLALLSQAVRALQRALEIRESIDPDHPIMAQSFHLLGGLYGQWGKYGTAEAYYKQALEICETCDGTDHNTTARVLESLVVLYRKQNKHDQAEPIQKRASAIRKKSQPVQMSPHKASALSALKKRALQLEDLTTGPDSVELARTLNELGVLYYLQNDHSTAEKHLKRSLSMRESLLPAEHLDIVQSLNNLAALYNDAKDYHKAEMFYESALSIRKSVLPGDHPTVVSSVRNLGMLYRKQGKFEQAEPLYKETVETREKCLGPNHPSVATALVNLAVIYCQQGKHTKALPLYEQALKVYEDNFGLHHPRVAETLRNLAVLRYEQGDYQTAASLYKRSTDIKEMTYAQKSFDQRSSSGESSNMRPPIAMSPQLLIDGER